MHQVLLAVLFAAAGAGSLAAAVPEGYKPLVAAAAELEKLPAKLPFSAAAPHAGYVVTQQRANGAVPFIDSHRYPDKFKFNFNLVPAFLTLPDGQDAVLVRSVNGTKYGSPGNDGTASTMRNPDYITMAKFVGSSSDPDKIEVEPIGDSSILLAGSGKEEACGVQDPRVVLDKRDGTYYMTYCAWGDPMPKDPKNNPEGIFCANPRLGLATSKTPQDPASWKRLGYECNGTCGKSAAILIREKGPHYMFWGIPNINVDVSDDLITWRPLISNWVTPDGSVQEMWIEAGSPPEVLDDGNYIMSYNIADSHLWWGIGYLILDKDDPTKILQRGSKLIWPEYPWEFANGTASWEPYKNCIGAMNSLRKLPGRSNQFLGYYVAGDAVSGAALITVTPPARQPEAAAANHDEAVLV